MTWFTLRCWILGYIYYRYLRKLSLFIAKISSVFQQLLLNKQINLRFEWYLYNLVSKQKRNIRSHNQNRYCFATLIKVYVTKFSCFCVGVITSYVITDRSVNWIVYKEDNLSLISLYWRIVSRLKRSYW